jgi:hypothetical protein
MSNRKESLKDDSSIIDEKEFKKLLSQDLINKINFVSETKRKNSNNCSDDDEESNKNIKKKPNKNEFNNEEIIPEKEKNKYHFNREINNQQNKFNLVINNSNNEINSNINFFNACFTKDGKSGWICPLCQHFNYERKLYIIFKLIFSKNS